MGFANWKFSEDGTKRIIFDDEGRELPQGSLVLVNGTHEHIIHFEGPNLCIHGWPDDDFIFSIDGIERDDQRDDWPVFI